MCQTGHGWRLRTIVGKKISGVFFILWFNPCAQLTITYSFHLWISAFDISGYDKEDKAARAYELAALKYWGPTTITNYPVCNYEKELEEMNNMTRQ
ncbi:putative transcription factor AP2-EREBP family [Helianthus debilis subsp. tardiflorus]